MKGGADAAASRRSAQRPVLQEFRGVWPHRFRTANPDIELKWDECAVVVKHYLKGETLGIQKAEKEDYGDGDYMWNFVPVTEGGKQVVREVTDEDLDELGPAVLDFWPYWTSARRDPSRF